MEEEEMDFLPEEQYEKLSYDELKRRMERDFLACEEFYFRYQHDDNPAIAAEAREALRSLAEDFDQTGFWPDWWRELEYSDDPAEKAKALEWKRKILEEDCVNEETLRIYGLID